MDAHDLVAALKNQAIELGRTPTRDEFIKPIRGGRQRVDRFGGYAALVSAAGLDPVEKRRKIDNSIFEKSIVDHLDNYQPRQVEEPGPYPTMAVISDIHWPFECNRVIQKFYQYVEENRPEWVILNGDAWDMYSHTKFPRSHNIFTPREEQQLSRSKNEAFWREIKRISPKSKCYQMMGNHDVRPLKRVMEAYPEAEDWIAEKIKALFTYDGVTTIHDPREELHINENTIVFHGYRSGLGDHRDYTLYNCINGHTHVGGTVFRRIRGATLSESNSGLAGDPEAKGLTYTPQKITKWTWGFFGQDQWGPRFIPA